MIYLAIVLSSLPLVLKTQVVASGDCADGSVGWEIGALLGRILILWWRWGWVVWLCFWLFVGVLKGRSWLAGLFGFRLYVGCNFMTGSMAKEICDSWLVFRTSVMVLVWRLV
jgi:hypothetical protein